LEADAFDLLIIDEASQVSVAQAFPALLRAKKVLILGDRKQFSNVKAAQARSDTTANTLTVCGKSLSGGAFEKTTTLYGSLLQQVQGPQACSLLVRATLYSQANSAQLLVYSS
jgi:AAA domain